MKSVLLRVAVVVSIFTSLAALPAGASHSANLVATDAQVTAASRTKSSAVIVTLHNESDAPVSLLSVTSAASAMNMIFYDQNMCQGKQQMTWLANILIGAHRTQTLGLRYQGAMLGALRQNLKVGQHIPLTLTWSDFSRTRHEVVDAVVVKDPKGLRFMMSSMSM